MIVEYHAIQSFVPANLNRDDAGAPKSCVFGGVPRARVSSQSWKRAMRMQFRDEVDGLVTGVRTKRAHQALVERQLAANSSLGEEKARHRAAVVLEAKPLDLGLVAPGKGGEEGAGDEVKTKQLVFFRDRDLDELAAVAAEFGEEIDALTSTFDAGAADVSGAEESKSKKKKGKATKPVLSKEAANRIKATMTEPGEAIDVALFGRMLAEFPEGNVDAACQVAHAIGTHRLREDFDFYTAVDDRRPEDTEGADMIGTVEFNASCLYRYAALDIEQLKHNLGPTAEKADVAAVAGAFTKAFATAIPSGKQNTFAARNLPAALLVTRRLSGAWNLANAFVDPVDGRRGSGGLAAASVNAMRDQLAKTIRMFGAKDTPLTGRVLSEVEEPEWGPGIDVVANIEDLIGWSLD